MGKKYIVEIKEGEQLYKAKLDAFNDPVIQKIAGAPYTEPDLEQVRKETFEKGYSTAVAEQECAVRGAAEKSYQKGLSDAWEVARKIRDMTWKEQRKVFGTDIYTDIIALPVSECIEKIRQYEQTKEDRIFDDIKDVLEETVKACNVTLDEIAIVLQKMRETE